MIDYANHYTFPAGARRLVRGQQRSAIERREEFRNAGGSIYGVWLASVDVALPRGFAGEVHWLNDTERARFVSALQSASDAGEALYVVYSYSTPVGYWSPVTHDWHRVEQSFSATTNGKHINLVPFSHEQCATRDARFALSVARREARDAKRTAALA